ncbi:diguanylate cyclase [Acidaminobacter sp. JC074]|uniref:sensor domain-containing diguanylate cyclase n=1 Tax=Acidaminobacter sp. JC074 TaxID=2530199 RepID=UPI001F0DA3A1|nr:diguanylate cyclase [Acidaminobacter sp. JC074]MCH4889669.1 diguanylate cyclase [Acidaminobacter sp. JC074]
MKNKRIIPITLINLMIIIPIMVVIAILNNNIINDLTNRDIQNVTRLTQNNIYADITREFIEPVNASIVMAQNTFAFDWMNEDTLETEERMAEYLTALQEALGYDSVFWIPHETLSYYHPGGTDAKVDLEDEYAFWYTDRIDAEDDYAVIVNTEQLDDYALTAYIDANIEDADGNFIGVAGVGKRIVHLQDILNRYTVNQEVTAYLVDSEGMILIHDNPELIKFSTFYELENIKKASDYLEKNDGLPVEKQVGDEFMITQYIPMLDWYLVVKKSESNIASSVNENNIKNFVAFSVGVIAIMIATSMTISRYKKQIISLSNTDQLTDMPNRRIFENALKEVIKNKEKLDYSLALFDLDNLKNINDEYGHDKGDFALKRVTRKLQKYVTENDLVARVGGDEFGVLIADEIEKAKSLLEDFIEDVNNDPDLSAIHATVSIGLTDLRKDDNESSIYKRADQTLYVSKTSGKKHLQVSKR